MRVGDVIEGRYELVEEAGRGSMGTVWRAVDLRLGREVAIKQTNGAQGSPPLRDEARAGAALHHPNVVVVHDVGTSGGEDFLVMEYVPGPSLREVLTQRGPLTADEAIQIVTGIVSGLAAAHAVGLWHGDVKPENVLMGDDGVARLTDFSGGSQFEPTIAAADSRALLTTIAYAPPEMLSGALGGPAADIYAAAMVLFESVTGRLPQRQPGRLAPALFVGDDATSLVSPGLRGILSRALHEEPERRYQSADDLLRALQNIGRGQPTVHLATLAQVPDATAVSGAAHPPRRAAKWLPVAVLAAVALSLGSAGIILGSRDGEDRGSPTATTLKQAITVATTATVPPTVTPVSVPTVALPASVAPQSDDDAGEGRTKPKKPKNPGRGNRDDW